MKSNRAAALQRIHASEFGVNTRASEPGHVSVNGVSLRAWNDYAKAKGLPQIAEPAAQAAAVTIMQAADALKAALGYSDDISVISDAESAFYDWAVLTPVRFDDLPGGVDYALADWCVNSGLGGALRECRRLFGVPEPAAYWRMDDILLNAIARVPAPLAVDAICNRRWSAMEVKPDFLTPSIVPGKYLGDGRAKRMSDCHRGAMELLGFAPEQDRYSMPQLSPPAAA